MKILRGFLAVVCLVLGVIALAMWGVAALVVKTVEDGSVVTGIAQKVVEQPAVQSAITQKTQAYVTASLSNAGVDVASLGLQGTVDEAVAAAVASPEFQASLTGAIDDARADFAKQLTSPDFAGAPLVVNLDVSAVVNQTIASIPVLGSLVPALTLEPLPIEVAGANEFGKVRGTYSGIRHLATWAGWLALVLIVAGVALWPRKRWLIPLALLFAGLGAGAVWAALRWLTVDRIAERLPGGADGDLGGALVKVAHQDSLDRFGHRVFLVAAACLVGAVLSFVIIKIASRPAKRRAEAARVAARAPVATEADARWADPAASAGAGEPGVSEAGDDETGATGASASGQVAATPVTTRTDHHHGQHEEHTPGHAR
jgi:hypothetical protein